MGSLIVNSASSLQPIILGNRNLLNNISFSGESYQYIVDLYSPTAAYSLRKLSSSATNAIRVRRTSDNSEQDIGFSGGDLDTASLGSFCSGTNGFIVTWYDQSGNAFDVTQSTAALQPQIVSSGSVLLENMKPSLYLNGQYLDYILGCIFSDGSISILSVATDEAKLDTDAIFDCTTATSIASTTGGFRLEYSSTQMRFGTATSASKGVLVYNDTDITQMLFSAIKNATDRYIRKNSLQVATSVSAGNNIFTGVTSHRVGAYNAGGAPFKGYIQEVIVFNTDETSNISEIETNINSYYSIY